MIKSQYDIHLEEKAKYEAHTRKTLVVSLGVYLMLMLAMYAFVGCQVADIPLEVTIELEEAATVPQNILGVY